MAKQKIKNNEATEQLTKTNSNYEEADVKPAVLTVKRAKWARKADFILSSLGYCVGFGNVWRFPYLAYRNGGASFLIPYFLMLAINGIPMFYLELAIGQWFSTGAIGVWKSICPLARGIGYAICIIDYMGCAYYIVILSWVLFYFFESFRAEVPWKSCDNDWNSNYCLEKRIGDGILNCTAFGLPQNCTEKHTSPSAEFWTDYVLQITDYVDDMGDLRWPLFGTLVLSWLIIYFCIFKGIKSSGKVVYFTATFPYIVLFILFIRGVTLDGAAEGLVFYLWPDWSKLADPQVWIYAASQIYWSLGIGFGTLITFGSYNKFKNNCYQDAIVLSCANCFTSFFSGFVIFSVLGFMAVTLQTQVKKVATSGPGLAFVAYPEAISQMPLSTLWALLFFFMLITLGLDTQFATIEAIVTAVTDELTILQGKWRRPLFIAALCVSMLLFGLPCVMQGGMWVFNLLDYQVAGLSIMFLVLCELITVSWIYGVDNFCKDVEAMTGKMPNLWFRICWKYISPVVTIIIVLANVIAWGGVSYNQMPYPWWAEWLGWMVALSSMLTIPGVALYDMWKTPGSFMERYRYLTTPDCETMEKIKQNNGIVRSPNVISL